MGLKKRFGAKKSKKARFRSKVCEAEDIIALFQCLNIF